MAFRHKALATVASLAAMALAAPAMAQGGCDRAQLQNLADLYVAAQGTGEGFRVPMGEWVQDREHNRLSSMT